MHDLKARFKSEEEVFSARQRGAHPNQPVSSKTEVQPSASNDFRNRAGLHRLCVNLARWARIAYHVPRARVVVFATGGYAEFHGDQFA